MKLFLKLPICFVAIFCAQVLADDYYISNSGDDSDPGTFSEPWETVQYAFDQVSAGDKVHIRGGKYHEAVVVNGLKGNSSNHITFTNYNGEEVVIAGTIQIPTTGWSVHSGSIYKTTLSQDVWQLFVDGDMMTAARWPNVQQDWHEPDTSSGFDPTPDSYWDMDSTQARLTINSSWGHFYNDENYHSLAGLNKSIEGAMLVGYRCLVSGNDVFTEQITAHTAGSDNFTHTTQNFAAGSTGSQAASGARYYIEAALDLLDAPGEWFFDKDTNELYVWFKDSGAPSGRYIEGKNKNFILDLTSCEHLDFSGIQLFAGAFDLSSTYDTSFENCRFIYPSYGRRMLKVITPGIGYVKHGWAAPYNRTGGSRNPANLTWRDCEFANFEGAGLYIRTHGGNLVENCHFHNGQIVQVVYGAASDHKSSGTIIRRTTFHTLGLNNATKNGPGGLLEYNHIYNMQFAGDFSASQTSTGAQEGTIHRYNWIHDCKDRNGIRFDGDPAGIRAKVHHVVSYHNMRGFRLKGDQHQIYNLTALENTPKSDINIAFEKFYGYDPPECMEHACRIKGRRGSHPYHGNENSIVRNIAGNVIDNWPLVALDNAAVWHGNDISQDLADQLRDPANLDFRPKAASDLVDAGVVVPGYADTYNGAAPDIGAYEYGDPNYWIPGCKFDKASTPIPPDGTTGVKTDADLMWLEGKDALQHKVYFGIESGNIPLLSTQTNNIFNPGALDESTEYFWRIDTVTATGTVTGDEWSFTLVIPQPETQTAIFYPTEDTYVDSSISGRNFGRYSTLELRTPSTGSITRRAFIKFNPQVTGDIVAATLRLHSINVLSGGIDIYPVADNSWREYNMVWDPASQYSPPAMAALSIANLAPNEGWDEADVSVYYSENGTRSIGLVRGPKDSNRRTQSRESAYPPELVIEYIATVPTNNPPYFQSHSFAASAATAAIAYSADISSEAADPDSDPLTFSREGGPAWLIVNADGTLAGTPQAANVGTNSFTMRVTDPFGEFDEGSMTIKVLPAPVNNPPAFDTDPVNEIDATEDVAYSGTLADDASDADAGDTLTFSKTGGPAWLIIAANGDLSGTPDNSGVGEIPFTVRVQDVAGLYDEAVLNIKVFGSPDINGSGEVDFVDFAMLSSKWSDDCIEPTWCDGTDLDINGTVDIVDLSTLAASWLEGVGPAPLVTGWQTAVVHGDAGVLVSDIEDGFVECRVNGITKLKVCFDQAMDTSVVDPAMITIDGVSGGAQAEPCSIAWETDRCMAVTLYAALGDEDTYTITVSDSVVSAQARAVGGDRDICITALAGDADFNGQVDDQDLLAVNGHVSEPVNEANCRYDVNCNGLINSQDLLAVNARDGNG